MLDQQNNELRVTYRKTKNSIGSMSNSEKPGSGGLRRNASVQDLSDVLDALTIFRADSSETLASTTSDESSSDTSSNQGDKSQFAALLATEEKAIMALKQSEDSVAQLSEKLYALYVKTKAKHREYLELEKGLSFQAGQLLSAMQQEETRATEYSTTVRRVRQTRKKMLAKIKNPRWEVIHHYHMTCVEHANGHEQAHVMDVGEMVPGHLRMFAMARWGALYQKSMLYALERAKKQRNGAHEQIKKVYRQLREIRNDMKQIEKLLDAIKKKAHLFPKQRPKKSRPSSTHGRHARGRPGPAGMQGRGRGRDQQMSIRRKYLTSLQITPPTAFMGALSKTSETQILRSRKQLGAAIDNEWKAVAGIVSLVLKEKKTAAETEKSLESVRKSRKNLHINSLPTPHFDPGTDRDESSDDDDNENNTDNHNPNSTTSSKTLLAEEAKNVPAL